MDLAQLKQDIRTIVSELLEVSPLNERHILVIGASTSEIRGKKIGTAGSEQIAEAVFNGLDELRKKHGFQLAFQCCEHLNRALVVEAETAERYQLDEVAVVPVPTAGGAMAAHAYLHMRESVMVEGIRGHAGIDIGDTFIGMHLRPVAVPVRPSIKQLGEAHVTMARTRPKLIGGRRAAYERTAANESCT